MKKLIIYLNNLKHGWTLSKTTKQKPTGYKGYCLTVYDKDDVTIVTEYLGKTLKKVNKMLRRRS